MLKIKNTGLFPFDRIIAKIKCENLLTGEAEEYEILASAPAKTETLQQLQLKSRIILDLEKQKFQQILKK